MRRNSLAKAWICGLLCLVLLVPQSTLVSASEPSRTILYTNDGSKTDIAEGAAAGLSAESVDAPYLGQGKAVRIYGTTANLTYSSGLGYFSTGSTTASAGSIVLEMDVCSNGGGLGMRMLQKNATAKSNIDLLQVAGTELSYKQWYHVAVQFDADGTGKNYTTWIGDQVWEQGTLEEAGTGLAWLRLQPLATSGDTYELYMTNVNLYIGSYTPQASPSVTADAPLTVKENLLVYTQELSAAEVLDAITVQQGTCLGVYQPDMETLRSGSVCSGDVVCIRGDEGSYRYYILRFDDKEFAVHSDVYTVDQTAGCIRGIVRGTSAEQLLAGLDSSQSEILLLDALGQQPKAEEAVDEEMQICTYAEDNLLRSYSLEFSAQVNWDFDKHMPRNENCVQLTHTYVNMQNNGLSLLLSPKLGDSCGLSAPVQLSDTCDVCSFSLYLPEKAKVSLSLAESPLLQVAEDNTVTFLDDVSTSYIWSRGVWTDCVLILNHGTAQAELWIDGTCYATADMRALPHGGSLELCIYGADLQSYVDDFLFYPVVDRGFARLQTIPREVALPKDIALNFSSGALFDTFFKVNTGSGTGNAVVKDGKLELTASAGGTPYVYTAQSKDFSEKTYINFSLNADTLNKSSLTVLLRDNNTSTTEGAIRFLKVGDGSITYLPDCTEVMVQEPLPAGDSVFCAVFDAEKDSLAIYRDGECKFTTTALSTLNDGRWQSFNWTRVMTRFSFRGAGSQAVNGDSAGIGHIIITEENLLGDEPVVFTPVYLADGEVCSRLLSGCIQYQTLYAPKDMENSLRVYLAEYRDETLVHMQASDAVKLQAGQCTTFATTVEATAANTCLRTFVWDGELYPYTQAGEALRIFEREPTLEQRRNYVNAAHPYVAIKTDAFEELQKTTNPLRASWKNALLAEAESVLRVDCTSQLVDDGQGNMVENSNYIGPQTYDGKRCNAGDRMYSQVSVLAFAYGISGDSRYAQAVWERLKRTAAPYGTETETLFADWNPDHFLDVAAMAYAYAIGYDWCYAYYTEEQKACIENSLEQYAFAPYQARFCKSSDAKAVHNRNLVNNGGILMAAAAMFDRNPGYYSGIVSAAAENMRYAMGSLNPDGGWFEGSNYWGYSMRYLIPALQTLQTLYGTDLGFLDYDGIQATGLFPFAVQGPTGTNDFHDSSVTYALTSNAVLFYLADALAMPWLNGLKIKEMTAYHRSATVFDALWYNEAPYAEAELPLHQYLQGVELVSLRSSFDSKGTWASFHGGITDGSHTHIDGGSFVFDYAGVRWACEVPHEDYNIGGYASGTDSKNTYYRVRAEGHNTLVIDPDESPGQDTDSYLTVSDYDLHAENPWATLDMTDAYKSKADQVLRRMELKIADAELQIQDTIQLKQDSEIYWFMHTQANAEVQENGKRVLLTKNGKTMELTVTCDHEAEVQVVPATRLETSGTPYAGTESTNDAYRKVQILIHGDGTTNLTVTFKPYVAENIKNI